MTPRAYLDAVRKRCEALTYDSGTWYFDTYDDCVWAGPHQSADGSVCEINGFSHLNGREGFALDRKTASDVMDARKAFIASARTDLPKLERIARLAEDYREARLHGDSDVAERCALFAALEELK